MADIVPPADSGSTPSTSIDTLTEQFQKFIASQPHAMIHLSLLGIEVAYSPRGYLLSQSKYIADILDQAHLSDARTVDTPLELNFRYSSSDGVALSDPSLYRTLVGSLVYLTITRPDIAYAVHIVSQFVASPTTVHWAAVLRILRYLRGTQF
ncbi:uncharacterized mitochondrial protein AtMg00810-like [Humulus lupulus]|uniref:uncharacterized mitochondrial protein AtMg00810-like n=1 Tax=Humulus lupulus TaxID=3486 RepID=UPI002B40BCA8|nr:uncharacterized mitochondrial protein AtMg00810-like [Humulus lupulus]